MRRIALVLLSGALLLAAACDDDDETSDAVTGSGNVITEEMPFTDFTAVRASHAFVAEITQADTFSVTVRVDDNVLDLLDVSAEGSTLRLSLEPGVTLTGDVTLEATITMPELEGLELSGAARASISGFRSQDQLNIELSGASSLDGDLEAGDTDIRLSGASRSTLQGTATSLVLTVSGASSLDLADFTVDTAEVSISGASEATVNVRERIDPVDVSGASRLRYLGDPSLGDVSTSGESTVDKIAD